MSRQSHAFAILVWITLLLIMGYKSYKYAMGQIETINFRFKTTEEITNANP